MLFSSFILNTAESIGISIHTGGIKDISLSAVDHNAQHKRLYSANGTLHLQELLGGIVKPLTCSLDRNAKMTGILGGFKITIMMQVYLHGTRGIV